jgi:hypothetical protein
MNQKGSTAGDSALAKDQKDDERKATTTSASEPSATPPASTNTTTPVAVVTPGPTTTSAPFADPKPIKGKKPSGTANPKDPPIDPKLGLELLEEARKHLPPIELPPPPPPQK